eukprot:comp20880_c0_seq3/m.43418 comp20880_c0_seq3/g.43418  ORF comp20880_c0_seq3/g.43418 comp20880_c0_seq3/m.43418 type:complete len:337 (+) comp20880_c0_seq3:663-1673(+)
MMQRSPSVLVLERLIGMVLDQGGRALRMALVARMMQRCLAILVHVVRRNPARENPSHRWLHPRGRGSNQRRCAVFVLLRDIATELEKLLRARSIVVAACRNKRKLREQQGSVLVVMLFRNLARHLVLLVLVALHLGVLDHNLDRVDIAIAPRAVHGRVPNIVRALAVGALAHKILRSAPLAVLAGHMQRRAARDRARLVQCCPAAQQRLHKIELARDPRGRRERRHWPAGKAINHGLCMTRGRTARSARRRGLRRLWCAAVACMRIVRQRILVLFFVWRAPKIQRTLHCNRVAVAARIHHRAETEQHGGIWMVCVSRNIGRQAAVEITQLLSGVAL